MAKDSCDTDCGWRYLFNGGARARCRRSKDCSCKCESLKAVNPNLYDGCVGECQGEPRPRDADDYMCNFVGGESIYSYHGILACGFSPEDSAQHKAAEDNARPLIIISIIGGTFLLMGVLNLLWKN